MPLLEPRGRSHVPRVTWQQMLHHLSLQQRHQLDQTRLLWAGRQFDDGSGRDVMHERVPQLFERRRRQLAVVVSVVQVPRFVQHDQLLGGAATYGTFILKPPEHCQHLVTCDGLFQVQQRRLDILDSPRKQLCVEIQLWMRQELHDEVPPGHEESAQNLRVFFVMTTLEALNDMLGTFLGCGVKDLGAGHLGLHGFVVNQFQHVFVDAVEVYGGQACQQRVQSLRQRRRVVRHAETDRRGGHAKRNRQICRQHRRQRLKVSAQNSKQRDDGVAALGVHVLFKRGVAEQRVQQHKRQHVGPHSSRRYRNPSSRTANKCLAT
ncbi:hypothetical protein H257_05032 [Aphanomyces astaci]|uniref:Uncharacterized protein n=1 Tax=Aphanomyces astaci TaxID=112090 RepID=W4GRM6_APHAT|nr:hypothetical protein H257_05032 [Aphanomyces astaci]ETV82380.1 hypothetical protein H257_05032 [Aphanomyces astaci]|eukprot:XP_009828049.1 hypothetical protein H257_05032 [Aphanomyces astaci]